MINKNKDSISFTIDTAGAGQRVDKFLNSSLEDKSRSYIQKLIKQKKVKVNSGAVNKNYRLNDGDVVTVEKLVSVESSVKPQKIDLNIVYEDRHILVVSKKAGMLTHPTSATNENTLVNGLLYYYCNNLSSISGEARAGIVHRLDKNTSGLLIVAKDDNVHRLLSEQFKSRKIKKTYAALAFGNFSEKRGKILLPIGRSRIDRKKMDISLDNGREAVTKFEVAEEFENCTLLDVSPKTGRTHQIRVHLRYINHPIIGDEKYGNRQSQELASRIGINRQFLHAKRIVFTHPVTGEKMKVEDKLAEDLQKGLKKLRRIKNVIK